MPLPFNHCYVYGKYYFTAYNLCINFTTAHLQRWCVLCLCVYMCAYVRHVEVKPTDIAALAV